MASPVPAKLQPLHNFSFTHLKWKNHRSGRSRLAGETSSSSPPPSSTWRESSSSLRSHTHAPSPPQRCQTSPPNGFRRPSLLHNQSPMRDSEFEADQNYAPQFIEKTGKRIITESSTKSIDNNHKRKRSNKISIRIRENSKQHDAVAEENHSSTPMDDSVPPPPPPPAEYESSPKTWNLRPRRPPMNHKQSTGGLPKIGTSRLQEMKTSHETIINKQLPELNTNNNTGMRKSKKQKFSIPLSRSEIEEDVFLLTGSKPSRRPKKRPRAIQRQLDNLFPGLWLDSITADSYKVSEASTKG
ncbi:hypothetical protein L6452_20076 [Arctium lappa]|uniref:Uncharacterized protein n=1 Tax=Arctium lappa TaxID=4217 RepID=A0ACB9B9L4_ARCLA|nr:hypothetical protein L6452_20076 [Arctium lappa]